MGDQRYTEPTEAYFRAALDLLSESGELSALHIEEICRRARRPRSLFYAHFTGLELFRRELLAWVVAGIEAEIFAQDSTEAEVVDVVARLVNGLGAGGAGHSPAYFAALGRLQSDPELQELHARLMARIVGRLEEAIARAQASRRIRSDVDPHDSALAIALLGVGQALWESAGVRIDTSRVGPTLSQLMGLDRSLPKGADSA